MSRCWGFPDYVGYEGMSCADSRRTYPRQTYIPLHTAGHDVYATTACWRTTSSFQAKHVTQTSPVRCPKPVVGTYWLTSHSGGYAGYVTLTVHRYRTSRVWGYDEAECGLWFSRVWGYVAAASLYCQIPTRQKNGVLASIQNLYSGIHLTNSNKKHMKQYDTVGLSKQFFTWLGGIPQMHSTKQTYNVNAKQKFPLPGSDCFFLFCLQCTSLNPTMNFILIFLGKRNWMYRQEERGP